MVEFENNTLRKVWLSASPGYAIKWYKMVNQKHVWRHLMMTPYCSKMKDVGSWPKDMVYTKCKDFTATDAVVRSNLDLRQNMKTVSYFISISELLKKIIWVRVVGKSKIYRDQIQPVQILTFYIQSTLLITNTRTQIWLLLTGGQCLGVALCYKKMKLKTQITID